MALINLTIYPQIYCWKKDTLDKIINGSNVDSYGDWVGIIGEEFRRYELNPLNIPKNAQGIEIASGTNYINQISLGLTLNNIIEWMGKTQVGEYQSYENNGTIFRYLKLIEKQEIKGTTIYVVPYLIEDSSDIEEINIALRIRYVAIATYKDEKTNETITVAFPQSADNPYLTILNAHKTFDNIIGGNQINKIQLLDYEGNSISPYANNDYTTNVLPYYIVSTLYGYGQREEVKMDGWKSIIFDEYNTTLENTVENISHLPTNIISAINGLGINKLNSWDLVNKNNMSISPIGNKHMNPENAYVQHKVNMIVDWSNLGTRNLQMKAHNEFTGEEAYIPNVNNMYIFEDPINDHAQFMIPSALFFDRFALENKLQTKIFTIPENNMTDIKRMVYATFMYKQNNTWYQSGQNLIENISGTNGILPDKNGGETYIDKIELFGINNLGVEIDANSPVFGNLYIEYQCKINNEPTIIECNTIPFGFNLRQIPATIKSASVELNGSSIETISLQFIFSSNFNNFNYAKYLLFSMKQDSISINYNNTLLANSWLKIKPITLPNPKVGSNHALYTFSLKDIVDQAGTKTYDGTHELKVILYDLNDLQRELTGTISIEIPSELRIETGTSVEFDPTAEFELKGTIS